MDFVFFRPCKFRLPALLTSDNASTWLVTRKNANDNSPSSSSSRHVIDNSKWLLKPQDQPKIDNENQNQWLANKSVMTTSANSLPGNLTLSKSPKDNLDLWLCKSVGNGAKNDQAFNADLDEWLLVAPDQHVQAGKEGQVNPFEKWQKLTKTYNWTLDKNQDSANDKKVQEWLIQALDNDNDDQQSDDDDFDDCSIEIIN